MLYWHNTDWLAYTLFHEQNRRRGTGCRYPDALCGPSALICRKLVLDHSENCGTPFTSPVKESSLTIFDIMVVNVELTVARLFLH
jgi:hypothetical protein